MKATNPDFLVSLGDLGESKDCTETKQLYAGTTECFKLVRDYFDGSDRTSKLYRTLFADDAPEEAEEWYDNLPNRRAAQLDPQRERLVARRLVATTRLAGEKPHS